MKDKCECGQELNFKISPFEANEKRVCPKCDKINYEDTAPIDFKKITKERDYPIIKDRLKYKKQMTLLGGVDVKKIGD